VGGVSTLSLRMVYWQPFTPSRRLDIVPNRCVEGLHII